MGQAKRWLKRVVPVPLLRPVFAWHSKKAARHFKANQPQEVFTDIFSSNYWGGKESVSGPGSALTSTAATRQALPRVIRQYGIRSILDAPCGDFHWMQEVDLGDAQYIGGDIVKPLVDQLQARYGSPRRRFIHLDITNDPLPEVDLIHCRECFEHLPFEMIHKALANFRRSKAKYFFATTYRNWRFNYDTAVGGCRALDLRAWPFNLPQPLELIQEHEQPLQDNVFRCNGLWSIESLNNS